MDEEDIREMHAEIRERQKQSMETMQEAQKPTKPDCKSSFLSPNLKYCSVTVGCSWVYNTCVESPQCSIKRFWDVASTNLSAPSVGTQGSTRVWGTALGWPSS